MSNRDVIAFRKQRQQVRTSATAWAWTAADDRPSPITMASWHGSEALRAKSSR